MSLILQAQLLLAAALLLALGFHRHRAAQVCACLGLQLLALDHVDPRLQRDALTVLPWLLLLIALVPEARLLSRRHAAFVVLLAGLFAMIVGGPPPAFEHIHGLPAEWLPALAPATASAVPGALAALICLLRWSLRGQSIELGLAISLLLASIGIATPAHLPGWFTAAAGCVLLTIVWASYRMAFVDQLTGLPNRRALDETLGRLSGGYSLAMVDVDHFKAFNDTYGHDAGDVVLRAVARSLRQHAGGRAFRYGGEEFCVVYGGRSGEQAAEQLDHAREQIAAQQVGVDARKRTGRGKGQASGRTDVSVTVSAGCAPRDARRRLPAEVLKAADKALYKAKGKGRNRVVQG